MGARTVLSTGARGAWRAGGGRQQLARGTPSSAPRAQFSEPGPKGGRTLTGHIPPASVAGCPALCPTPQPGGDVLSAPRGPGTEASERLTRSPAPEAAGQGSVPGLTGQGSSGQREPLCYSGRDLGTYPAHLSLCRLSVKQEPSQARLRGDTARAGSGLRPDLGGRGSGRPLSSPPRKRGPCGTDGDREQRPAARWPQRRPWGQGAGGAQCSPGLGSRAQPPPASIPPPRRPRRLWVPPRVPLHPGAHGWRA